MALHFLGVLIIFTISRFDIHQVKLPWLHRQWWVAPVYPTTIHRIIRLGAIMEYYHKLQPKPKIIPEFKDAVQLIW